MVVALGVPLFGVLTGSRSQEAGQNLVAAAIGQARTIAVNEGKYAGILFYVDPATERTAFTIVSSGGLEDPDPYDKYKTWTSGQRYRAPGYSATTGAPIPGDRAIGLASDSTATFRATPTVKNVYDSTQLVYSRLSLYMPNFKPTVRTFRASQNSNGNDSANADRPPRNGPTNAAPAKYIRIPTASSAAGSGGESTNGGFTNDYWGKSEVLEGGEQNLLPIGVGVQLIIPPTARADDVSATPFTERYVRTGVIMFDPQGRLTLDPRQLGFNGTLGKYLGLTADVKELLAGVGVVFYDRTAFRANPAFTEGDWHYENVAANTTSPITSTQVAFTDNNTQTAGTVAASEGVEETWLDGNTVPLLINRFSGALSEGQ